MLNVGEIRRDFPALENRVQNHPLVYLDNAATMQTPEPVLDAVHTFYKTSNANVHRGVHTLSRRATAAMERARETAADFVNAGSASEIIFTAGTTDSINMVACGLALHEGDEVVITDMEHHSNYLPWQEACARTGAVLRVIPVAPNGELDMDALRKTLSPRTVIVAAAWVSNVLGTVNPIREICALAHEAGALILIDGAQGMKLGKTDVRDLDCDFLAFSGHKLGALTGTGVLYGKTAALERLRPPRFGGGMVKRAGPVFSDYEPLPLRLEAGTPNYAGAVSLGRAIDYLTQTGLSDIAEREKSLTDMTVRTLSRFRELHILGMPAKRCGSVSFYVDGVHAFDLGAMLDAQGIAVRTGNLCAQPLLNAFGVTGVVRVSPAFYNTENEIQSLERALDKTLKLLNQAGAGR